VSTPGDSRKAPPAGLKVNHEPREPKEDPTLGIPVDVDRTGTPKNRLVTIGAYELGMLDTFRYPVYEPPGGPGGLPIDIERALRAFESRFGSELNWYEIVGALRWLQGYLDDIEDYWERGDGANPPARKEILHNLAVYGWDLRDTLSLNATKVRQRMKGPTDDPWLPRQKVEDDNDRAALYVLESARGARNRALTPLEAAQELGKQGTEETGDGHGIETLVVILGANNALQTVTKLKVDWSGPGYDDVARKGGYTVWRPEHFVDDWKLVVEQLRRVRARHVIVGTVPAVTIAPIAKGVGGKVARGSRYFRYYTRPWISEADFEPESDDHITEDEARWVDSAIDAFNGAIIESVEKAREDGLDWYVFELGGLLDRLATKRYIADPAARPAWWTPYPLPPALAGLDPVPNTRFFASGPEGRTDGGLFSLDGIHPTTISAGVIANEVMAVMNRAQVVFRKPTGEVRPPPVGVDFGRVLAADTLINSPPTSLSSNLATLGWLDDRLGWVRAIF
jgi:hypothetical protein